jgi:hypothetical protein
VLFVSTGFSLLFIVLSVMQWDEVTSYQIVKSAPMVNCGVIDCTYFSYAIKAVHDLLGGDYLIGKAEKYISDAIAVAHQLPIVGLLTAKIPNIVFTEWPGSAVAGTIYFVTWLWLFGVYSVLWRQRRKIGQLLLALEKTEPADLKTLTFLKWRAEVAPPMIQNKLVSMAVSHTRPSMRSMAIDIAHEHSIDVFPPRFLERVHEQPKDIKEQGLRKIIEFVTKKSSKTINDSDTGNTIRPEIVSDTLNSLIHQTTTNKIMHAPNILDCMDELLVTYTEWGLRNDRGVLDTTKLGNRLWYIVVHGANDLAQRALPLCAKYQSLSLCHSLIESFKNGTKFSKSERGKKALAACEQVIVEHRDEWRPGSQQKLRNSIEKLLTRRQTPSDVKAVLGKLKAAIPSQAVVPNPGYRGSVFRRRSRGNGTAPAGELPRKGDGRGVEHRPSH